MKIELDLYERYSSRKDGLNLIANEYFYVYLRILLACDVIHDFLEPRGVVGLGHWTRELGGGSAFEAYKNRFLSDNVKRVIADCVSVNAPLVEAVKLIEQRSGQNGQGMYSREQRIVNLFNSEKKAKDTADVIHKILGLTMTNLQDAMLRNNPCNDFNVLDLIRTLDVVKSPGKNHARDTKYNITIDTTSDKTNLTPFFSEIMNRAYRKGRSCPKPSNEINIINSYASQYDSATGDALTKLFTDQGLSRDLNPGNFSDLEFVIKCGVLPVFNGVLKKGNDKVKLHINSYFTKTFRNPMTRKTETADSVNGITEDMLKSHTTGTVADELLDLTVFKTMGDFLQIMTHLHLSKFYPNDINVFVTFDILCAKIAGILDKNVFYEKKFTSDMSNSYKISGLYTFLNETAIKEREVAEALVLLRNEMSQNAQGLDMLLKAAGALQTDVVEEPWLPPMYTIKNTQRKRSRYNFGKKQKSIKNVSNKALMTKLKSVGIKITRKRGKHRVYLSRSELIKRATAFKNLQLRAKKLKVRIMYKNRKGKYIYKTAKRLMNDLKRKKSVKKSNKKPVKKSNKKPNKKPVKKQMKQRFG